MLARLVCIAICTALALLSAACSGPWPAREYSPGEDVPPVSIELETIPFFPQDAFQCGPAALATLLTASGIPATPEDLEPRVYLPSRRGSLQLELLAAARRQGRIPYRIDPSLVALAEELGQGRAVLVLQNLGLQGLAVWHYAVVVGMDAGRGQVILRSGAQPRQVMSIGRFMQSWEASGSWGLVLLVPGDLPALPVRLRYLAAVASLEGIGEHSSALAGYDAALRQWPGDELALLGRANALYGLGDLEQAQATLQRLILLHPDHALARNNLAVLLAGQGCFEAALRLLDAALAEHADDKTLVSKLNATRREIVAGKDLALGSGTVKPVCAKLSARRE